MTPRETPQHHKDHAELAGLPAWLYPAGFWVTLVLLALGVLVPRLSFLGVISIGTVPVLATLWVAVTAWQRDRRLSLAALAALGGLALVFIVKQFV
ncbi:hypothetical protein D3875_05500 [Deinococcus cavernae]|uniref:Uncharacterized protein n=1 Tax=Deinococcus cavernae TaxID=2320857 RepID=A0A418V502_9DEIO|nr:hypothetical protein [Deinococcus cavernae]RJF71117.1 hypothetical protein D3875_05500 [Deinococcus cavernae]